MRKDATIVCAADSAYFDLLKGLILSIKDKPQGRNIPISLFDVGLSKEQLRWAEDHVTRIVEPEWNFDFPDRKLVPKHFKALLARPFIPRYFPGYEVYLSIDADAWVQDWSAVEIFLRGARRGKLAITAQIDRAYKTFYKRPKPLGWTQNYKCFRWSYGWLAADRLGRNPILNAGVFALPAEAVHWDLWADAIELALNRKSIRRRGYPHLHFWLVEQTALNYVVFKQRAPATFLPAYCNWFCALAAPMVDDASALLVEPHEPHHPLGVVHLAGTGFKEKVWSLKTLDGRELTTSLHYQATPSFLPGKSDAKA